MKIERWKPIEGTNGAYKVSDCGRVRSVGRKIKNRNGIQISVPGGVLSQATDRCGYKTVVLRIDNKSKTFRVHRLVAITFVEKVLGKEFIDHIDNNKGNNHYTNLRWVTRSENMLNPITVARLKNNPASRKCYNGEKVYQYTMDKYFVKIYPSIRDAARQNNVRINGIRFTIQGKQKSCGGYIWSLIPLK